MLPEQENIAEVLAEIIFENKTLKDRVSVLENKIKLLETQQYTTLLAIKEICLAYIPAIEKIQEIDKLKENIDLINTKM
jgi:hypothetical protein